MASNFNKPNQANNVNLSEYHYHGYQGTLPTEVDGVLLTPDMIPTLRLSSRADDLTGQKFGRLTAIKPVSRLKHDKSTIWLLECECGALVQRSRWSLGNGQSRGRDQSCGCAISPHGQSKHPAMKAYYDARRRCYYKLDKDYPNYGGRGIEFSVQWRTNPAQFIADMGAAYKPGLTLDWIDNDGPYSKDNCRWATRAEQSRNKRVNVWVEAPGLDGPRIMSDAAEQLALSAYKLRKRLNSTDFPAYRVVDNPDHRVNAA